MSFGSAKMAHALFILAGALRRTVGRRNRSAASFTHWLIRWRQSFISVLIHRSWSVPRFSHCLAPHPLVSTFEVFKARAVGDGRLREPAARIEPDESIPFGNEYVAEDKRAIEVARELEGAVDGISFVLVGPNEDVPFVDERRVVILDTVHGIREVTLVEGDEVDGFILAPRGSVHDFDLAFSS